MSQVILKTFDFASKTLGFNRGICFEDMLAHLFILEQACFSGHHPMFSGRKILVFESKPAGIPLRKTALTDTSILARAMPPEVQKVNGLTAFDSLDYFLSVVKHLFLIKKQRENKVCVFYAI